jgi:NAD(P)-dependent dehydrogenase (short-subunit alcohol dehydrogenase family)
MDKKVIIVTGGTRGIGFALSEYFLKHDCIVVYSGTSQNSIFKAQNQFDTFSDKKNSLGVVADISSYEDCESLVEKCIEKYGKLDICINNAGISLSTLTLENLEPTDISKIADVNLKGSLFTARAALKHFKKVGKGAFYVMEGFGSDGRMQSGMACYGATKSAVRYLARSLAKEQAGTDVIVGALSPGMVVTDLLTRDFDSMDEQSREKLKRIFNILADKPQTVANFLGEKILKNTKNGAKIYWLTNRKVMGRFLTAKFKKRDLF